MKKLLFIFFLFISLSSFSQGNLQFNKVINLNYYGTGVDTNKATIASVTIPDGKVWKVTYVFISYADNGKGYLPYRGNNNIDYTLEIGGIFIPGGTDANTRPVHGMDGVVWLDSGTTPINIVTYENAQQPYNVSISAIEFNVVQ